MSLGINPGVQMSKLKSRILNPAMTSVYSVLMNQPAFGMRQDRELFELTCIEASLPGSSLATVETSRDYLGIVEKHQLCNFISHHRVTKEYTFPILKFCHTSVYIALVPVFVLFVVGVKTDFGW